MPLEKKTHMQGVLKSAEKPTLAAKAHALKPKTSKVIITITVVVVSALIASKYVDVSKLTQPGSTFDNVNARNSVEDLTPLVKYTFDFFGLS
jgi:hypothetical protein